MQTKVTAGGSSRVKLAADGGRQQDTRHYQLLQVRRVA